MKPRGNPLAAGRSLAGDGPDSSGAALVTVRLRETAGRATAARVRLALGAGSVREAWRGDLLEGTDDGEPLPVVDGAIAVDMPAFGTVTLAVRVGPLSREAPARARPGWPRSSRSSRCMRATGCTGRARRQPVTSR